MVSLSGYRPNQFTTALHLVFFPIQLTIGMLDKLKCHSAKRRKVNGERSLSKIMGFSHTNDGTGSSSFQ